MKKRLLISSAIATLLMWVSPVIAAPQAAQVLFSNGQLKVIDAKGIERLVKQGDLLQPGERVVSPPGVLSQLKLPDGTLIGMRNDSEIRLDQIDPASGRNIIALNFGNVRVINTDSLTGQRLLPTDIVTPVSRLMLENGDGESVHVRPGTRAGVEGGTYNRLLIGNAVMRTNIGELPLLRFQNGFVPRLDVLPNTLAVLPPTLNTLVVGGQLGGLRTGEPQPGLDSYSGGRAPALAGGLGNTFVGPGTTDRTTIVGGQTLNQQMVNNYVALRPAFQPVYQPTNLIRGGSITTKTPIIRRRF